MAFITAYWSLDGMIVLMTLIITVHLYMTHKFNYWKKRNVLHAQPISILGNFKNSLLLKRSPGYLLKDFYDEGKGMPYIGFYVLGKPFLLVRDRELIKNVLIKDFDYFIDRYATPNTTDRLAYSSLFFIKNPAWKILRMKLSPTFTSGKQKKMFDLMLDCGDNLDTYFESLKLEDKDIELDMKDLSSKFFIDIVGTTAYGLNVNSLNNPDNEFPKYSKQIFEVSILHAFEFLMILFLPNLIRFFINVRVFNKKVTAFLRNVFWQTITQRIKSGKKRNDLIDALIKLKGTYRDQDSERKFTFDGDDLLAQAAIFFIASYETSSTTMIFTLYELARHPEVQNRLRKEILNALDETDGKITYNMVMSLPYLDMVVSEILRMYPPLPFLDRITKETYKVPNSDLVLEKGTPIYISLLGMHYDPEYYPTPDKFDPERFTEENKRNRPPYVYLPFGNGPRMCIGSRMGLLQSKLGIIVILRKYEVKPCKKTLIPMVIEPASPSTMALGAIININYTFLKEVQNYTFLFLVCGVLFLEDFWPLKLNPCLSWNPHIGYYYNGIFLLRQARTRNFLNVLFRMTQAEQQVIMMILYQNDVKNSSKMALVTTYWGLDGMIILMTLIITAYLYMTRKFKYWKKRGILEITPMPFFGNFKECLFQKKAPAYFLKDIYDEMKDLPYVGFYVLDKPFLLVRDRELVKNILVKDFNYFSDRYNSADPIDRIGYANLFFIKNPAWKVIRTKLTPLFTSGKMKKMFDLMLTCVKNLDEYLDALELEGNGKTIEVRELTAKFATDIIGSTAYGLDVNSFKDPNAEFRKYGKMIFHYDTYRSFEMLAIFFLPTIVRLTRIKMFGKEPTDFMRKVFWETLTHRMKSGLKRNDLIDILLELKNNNNNDQDLKDFTFDGDDLLAQAASFFSAGFETSSTTTTFALYELAMQPEIQNTLRKEISEALKKSNGKITYDMVWSLPYLDMVISETLRMYPPLGYLNRVPNQTYKVPKFNLVIEKGTPVYISMLGLHYDPEYFPNPNKFDPEQFNEENKRKRPSCVYFPFGEGPHACIGNRFGLLQAKLTLLKILSKCEVTLCKETLVPVVIDPRGAMTVPLNGKGQIIEMTDMSSKLTMDMISSTYGLNVNTFKNPNLDFFKYGKKMFTNNYLRGLEILAMFFLPNITRIASLKLFGTESTAFLRKLFWETMTKRMESGEKRYDLIDILIELKKNNHDYKIEGFEFDEDVLMAQAVSFFAAGFDTTSQPIIFTLYELALQPDIQNTLRKEIHQALNNFDGKITYDMIMSLSYMNMVISETLRKYPPLGFLNRKTMETYQIPNFNLVLEKDTPVYIPVFALHYDPEYFPNPEKFDPERFNKENKCNMPSCVYLPFGDGPHMCIGNRFALLMIKLALTKILNKYEVTPCEKTTIPVIIDPAVALTGPLNKIMYLNMRKANTVTD
ncbi:CP6K1 protein, partial [Acromyrmex heyeri]